MELTDDQRRKIEENRIRALALRANKQSPVVPSFNSQHSRPVASHPVAVNQTKSNFYTSPGIRPPAPHQTHPKANERHETNSYGTNNLVHGGFQSSYSSQKKLDFVSSAKNGSADVVVVARCVLLSRKRFAVDVKFFAPLIELFKLIDTRQYDAQKKLWSFDLQDYSVLVNRIRKDLGKAVTLEELPKSIVKLLNAASDRTVPDADLLSIDRALVETLMPFQRQGINFAVHHKGRILLADDMGLGKTIQALCIAAYYRHEWPLLVVVPSSVRFAWQQQILEWLPSTVKPHQVNMILTSRDDSTSGLVNIISYDLMVKCHAQLMAKNFKIVIMDESHFLKSSKTARTQKALPLLKKATRVLLLSGTPALSRPSELYAQLSAVDPNLFPKFHDYGIRYCEGKQLPWGWDFTGSSNMAELQIILEEKIMIRRLKSDVLHQLPSKCRTMVILDPSSVKVNKTMKNSHLMVNKMKGAEQRGALLEYFHETAEAKSKAVSEYVLDLLESDRKFLLFGHHKLILDAVEEAVQSKYKYIRIDGRTNPEQRNFFCEKFQNNDNVKLAILSITAANTGINLTSASLVIFAELFWNPGILAQAEDRVHRIGQEDSVTIQYLVARDTADDYIWPMIQRKLTVLGKAGLSKDDYENTDTKLLQDKKQKDLLDYFLEDDDDASDSTTESKTTSEMKVVCSTSSSSSSSSRSHANQKTVLEYFKTTPVEMRIGEVEEEEESLHADSADSDATVEMRNGIEKEEEESLHRTDSVDSDATVDWAEGVNDLLDDIDEDEFDSENPISKKSRFE